MTRPNVKILNAKNNENFTESNSIQKFIIIFFSFKLHYCNQTRPDKNVRQIYIVL